MKIYNKIMFARYLSKHIRIKKMGNKYVAIGSGFLLASFNSLENLRKYFPFGTYKLINENSES